MRKYSVQEIAALRRVVETKYLYGSYRIPQNAGMSRTYKEDEKIRAVEAETQTAILAGHTAEDLISSETP